MSAGVILECAGWDPSIPEASGIAGSVPWSQPYRTIARNRSKRPAGEIRGICQIWHTTPMQAQPRCCGKDPPSFEELLCNSTLLLTLLVTTLYIVYKRLAPSEQAK